MERIRRFLDSPYTNIAIALVLVISSLGEGVETFVGELSEFDLGVHHGVLLFGLAMLLRGLVETREALDKARKSRAGNS